MRNRRVASLLVSQPLSRFQNFAARLLGCDPAARSTIVAAMLHRDSDATGYWLKLVVSLGIATLGLALNSSAVVIGAMLIAPLMSPIVSLGMGLAVGSPFLVLRSSGRVVLSVVVAFLSSAMITWLLPFNELNTEIAARTTPTALDLFVAAFCALAGVYASLRTDSDVASTAAGTSIGISLVPPLCASGFGAGTALWPVASGAALLFLTNFVAIVVVSTGCFAVAGFNQVNVKALEIDELGAGNDAPIARRLARIFASRSGPWLRLSMPFALLAAVYLPLERALDEVVWQIRARKDVQAILSELPHRLVQSHVRVERGKIELSLMLLGSIADARTVRSRVAAAVQQETGIVPRLDVMAIPDASAFELLEASLRPSTKPVPTPELSAPAPGLEPARDLVRAAFERRWPREQAGAPLALSVDAVGEEARVRVVRIGSPMGAEALETLERILAEDFGQRVRIVDEWIPKHPLVIAPDHADFVAQVARLLASARTIDTLSVCVREPNAQPGGVKPDGPAGAAPVEILNALLRAQPRVTWTPGDTWSVQVVPGPCPTEPAAPPKSAG